MAFKQAGSLACDSEAEPVNLNRTILLEWGGYTNVDWSNRPTVASGHL
jgi:hypothetical protein